MSLSAEARRRYATRLVSCVVATLMLVGVSACGGDDESESAGGGGEAAKKTTTVDVAYIEVTSAAPLLLGVDKGFFKEEGLDVKPKPTEAAATIPAVVSGDVDITFSNPPATLLGKSNGLPLKAIAPAAVSDPSKDAYIQLLTQKDSGIKDLKDLAGKKVAVDTLFQLPHIALLQTAKAEGVDPDAWKVTEIPFPAMTQALKSGKVDAAFMGEPFLTQAMAQGNASLVGLYEGWEADTPFSMYVTSQQYLAKNGDAAKRFARAMKKSNEYASQNEAELRRIMPTFLKMPKPVADKIILPVFAPTLNTSGLEKWKSVMTERKVLKKEVDLADLTSDAN